MSPCVRGWRKNNPRTSKHRVSPLGATDFYRVFLEVDVFFNRFVPVFYVKLAFCFNRVFGVWAKRSRRCCAWPEQELWEKKSPNRLRVHIGSASFFVLWPVFRSRRGQLQLCCSFVAYTQSCELTRVEGMICMVCGDFCFGGGGRGILTELID